MRIGLIQLMIIFLVITASLASSTEILVVGADQWPPFADINESGKGICFVITEEAFSVGNYMIDKKIMPAKRLMNQAETLRVDAICNLWYNEKRNEKYLFSKAYLYNSVHLWVLSDKEIEFNHLKDLTDLKIGIISGYYNGQEFDSADYLNKVIVNDTSENLIRLLINKRVDIVVCDKIVAESIIKKKGLSGQLKYLDKPLFQAGLHLAVSREHPGGEEIISAFNSGIREIKTNGRYLEILTSHGFSEIEVDPGH